MRKSYGAQLAVLSERMEELERERVTAPTPGVQGRGAALLNAMIATEQLDGRFTFADVIVVGVAAITTGLMLTAASGAVGVLCNNFETFKLCAAICWLVVGLLGALVLTLELLGVNLYGTDPQKGDASPQLHALTVTVQHAGDSSRLDYLHVDPADFERTRAFARQILQLRIEGIENPTPEKYWIGKARLWSNSTADRARFTALRDRLIECKLARQLKHGWELRESGWTLLAEICNLEGTDV